MAKVNSKTIELTASVKDIRWPPQCDSFFIAKLKIDDESHRTPQMSADGTFTAVGNCEVDEIKTHLSYRWFGEWVSNERFGPQFKASTWTPAKPHGKAGVVKYLQQCDGIGEATALHIWHEFNSDSVRICREHPEVVAAKIKRLTLDKAKELADQLTEMSDLEDTSIDLIETLNGRGFPKKTAREALRVWGARAPAVINADPYKLMRFRGCGFGKCDKMYLDLGLPPARMKRQVCCAWHAIATDRDGHVWLPLSRAVEGLSAKIAGVEVDADKAISIAKRFGALTTHRDCARCGGNGVAERMDLFTEEMTLGECPSCSGTGGRTWIAESKKANAERRVVQRVADMLGWDRHWPDISGPAFDSLTDHQRAELTKATTGAIGAFCGSPGAGKTYSIAALVRAILKLHGCGTWSVAICAPTGKAAQRARESMRAHGLDVPAMTIHRLLGVEQADDGDNGWSFKHNATNPLPQRFIICDEASMIGLSLMSSLLDAFARGTNFLMVGDVNQLLPVDYGAPLRDLKDSVPYGELTEIHRNSGSVVRACKAIRENGVVRFDDKIELNRVDADGNPLPPKNLVLVQADAASAQRKLLELVKQLAEEPKAEINGRKFDPIRDIQVLVAVNKKSPLSRKTLSPLLQSMLNPNGRAAPGSPFRVGDKVMQTKNEFLKLVDPLSCPSANAEGRVDVSNGEFGIGLESESTRTVVEFANPKRVVVIPKARGAAYADTKQRDDDDASDESDGTGCNLVLGYASTCHKLQGSSADTIIVALDEYAGATGPYGNVDRAWVYTAISRMERRCYVVGLRSVLDAVCRRTFITKRKTFTKELLAAELASRASGGKREASEPAEAEDSEVFA